MSGPTSASKPGRELAVGEDPGRSAESAPVRPRAPITYPEGLPISARVADIAQAVRDHQVVIVAGSTGSGKTTQLPKILLELGRGTRGLIGVTQPRRIAATSVAERVASELACRVGEEVGYQIRFEDRTSPRTYVKFMTDGILLAEIQSDPQLSRYDTLVIDEAHERSLTIDFLLGWLKRLLPRRPDLKVLVSSATIETARFAEFFGAAKVIEVEGRTFPVEVLYEPPAPELELADAVADAVVNITELDPRGDVLVFLPGEREIREAEQALAQRNLRHTLVQPLYSRLSASDQRKVWTRISERRVILATNVAETSLTIPGIVYVVDTGLARLSRYQPRTGTTGLPIEAISRASADQRKGRCGRVRDGICVRLYDEADFVARPEFTDPEVKRTGLAGTILRMKALGLGDVEEFPFLDPPSSRSITEGYRVLQELGALDDERALTELGRRLAHLPVDPRIGRMILGGVEQGCLEAVLILAAALNIQDPRERPRGFEQQADQAQREFKHEQSDFLGLLALWALVEAARRKGQGELRRFCKSRFLSFVRVREWTELHRQLSDLVRELRLTKKTASASGLGGKRGPHDELSVPLHRALLSGLLSRIGQWNAEQRVYYGAKQTRFALHPSSGLAKKPPNWVMAFELVETSQVFARTVAKLDPEWLDEVGAHLLKRSYADPTWSEKSAKSTIKEHATLFGLPVFRGRSIDYARVAPARARLMFLEHALVRGEYRSRGAFQERNRELVAEAARLRDKARKSELFADDEGRLSFFDRRVPETVVNGVTFEAWRERAEKTNPTLLELTMADMQSGDVALSVDDYPDELELKGVKIRLSYRFDPSADDDGLTLEIPLALVPQLTAGELEWTIPGWHEEKLVALLETLPRARRRELALPSALGAELAPQLVPFCGEMLKAVRAALRASTSIDIPEEAFRPDAVPPYLRLTCKIVGERGAVLGQGRNVAELLQRHGAEARAIIERSAPSLQWEQSARVEWDFGDLPAFVTRQVLGAEVRFYPALVDRKTSIDLKLLDDARAANQESVRGVRRLLALALRSTLLPYAKRCPSPFLRRLGLPPSRTEVDAGRELLLERTLIEAFPFVPSELPRSRADFEDLRRRGTPLIGASFEAVTRAYSAVAAELAVTRKAVEAAAKQPSGARAAEDVRAQLEELCSDGQWRTAPLANLQHIPRYLRAAQLRLTRAIADPRKDEGKLQPLLVPYRAWLEKRLNSEDVERARAVGWAFEELRVAIFAPELKPAQAVSVASLTRAVADLR